jgi:hypothetical protein
VAPADLEEELARGIARWAAVLLVGGSPSRESRVDIVAVLLSGWAADAEARAALRPVFEAAAPDQRALIALGDIDAWLRDGRIARGWWLRAAAGPDRQLAALGAWRAAQADLRGAREDDARPLLEQADAAGIRRASLALGRLLEKGGDDDAAARLFRRSGSDESLLRLAEIRLRADDTDGAELEIADVSPEPRAWEAWVRGEIAFRRGLLGEAEEHMTWGRSAPGGRGRHADLRLAQIAIAQGDAFHAYTRTTGLAEGTDAEADHARLLIALHRDLIDEGARWREQEDEEEEED